MNAELKNILFVDIETISCEEQHSSLDERLKTQWARKAGFFRRNPDQTDEDMFHERAGIYAEFGKIIVVAIGKYAENEHGELCIRTKCFADHDEEKLLNDFKGTLEKLDAGTRLCAHNGKEFDFPYLSRRMLVNGITLPGLLNLSGKKSWEIPHLDTMEMWKFGDYKHYTSLDLLSAIFKIPTSKGVMDGSQVNAVYYKERDLKKIADYCVCDVVAIAQLFLKLKCMNIVPDHNIIHSS